MKKLGLTLVLIAALSVGVASAAVVSGPVTWEGHDYYVLSAQSWGDAEAEAIALGGHLVTIGSAAEQAFVYSLINSLTPWSQAGWIGFTDAAVEGTWVWSSGEPVTYTHWSPSEPNNSQATEHCGAVIVVWEDGLWNDATCTIEAVAVAEIGVDRVACASFEPPMASGPVEVRGNRALPLKAQLFDAEGYLVTDTDFLAPPVIQVWYEYGTPEAEDVSGEALPAGQSTEGNQFFFGSDQRWHYNLKTKNYSAPGTYTVFMDSGAASEYVVDPTCTGQFVVK